jgi:hypothetical protein
MVPIMAAKVDEASALFFRNQLREAWAAEVLKTPGLVLSARGHALT